jgi:hypothetical protein
MAPNLIIIRHLSSNFLSVFLSISSVQVFHVVLNHAIHFNASGSETPYKNKNLVIVGFQLSRVCSA